MASDPTIKITPLENITWNTAVGCDFNLNNHTDIWLITISQQLVFKNQLWPLLSADEQTRAGKYHHANDTNRFIVSRGYLRVLLGKYLGCLPQLINFETAENKKPYVKTEDGYNLHYNVSHSGDRILIAVSNKPVGIDIEQTDDSLRYTEIMPVSFSEQEINAVTSSQNPIEKFYSLWTRKEALLKATGKGIDDDMKLIPSLVGEHQVPAAIIGSNDDWFVKSFRILEDYSAGLAAQSDHQSFWQIEDEDFFKNL